MKMKTTKITAVISSLIAIAVLCSTMFTAPQIKAIDGEDVNAVCVTYHGNGGITDDYLDSYVSEGDDIAENMFHKASDVFVSWNTQANGLGDTYTPGSEIPANCASLDLYAAWDTAEAVTMFNVIYNGNGGKTEAGEETVISGQAKAGDVVQCIDNPGFAREGFKFAGWNTKADGKGQTIAAGKKFQMPNKEFTLYAMWEEAPASDGDKTDSATDSAVDTNNEEKTDTADDTNSEEKTPDSEEDDGKYRVIYNGNGGLTKDGKETAESEKYAPGDTVTAEDAALFEKEGFVIVSWNTKADGSGQNIGLDKRFQMIGKDLTLYAVWEEKKEENTDTTTDTSKPSDKDNTTDTSKSTDTEKKDTDTLKEDMHSLTYVIDSDTKTSGGQFKKGEIVTVKSFEGTAPEGKIFSHWSTTADDTGFKFNAEQTFEMPGADVLLYAIFVDEETAETGCTVTYNSNFGDTDNLTVVDGPYDYRAVVSAKSNSFERPGYTFICWNTEADGSGKDVLASDRFYMPSTSVVLYAKWAVNGSPEANAALEGRYSSYTTSGTYSGAVKTGVDNTIVVVASAVLIISLAVLVMCSVKGKKREE